MPCDELGPISKLPPEILEEIFALCISWCDGFQKPKNRFAWSQVCRAWRQISFDSGRLWQRVNLSDPRLAAESLIRSKQAPLHITTSVPPPSTIPKDLALYADRLQSIDVILNTMDMAHLFVSVGQHLPMLKDLSLKISPMTSTLFLDLSLPSIRRLSLEGVTMPWERFENLTYLSLRGHDQAFFPSLSQLHRMLVSSPDIEFIRLECFVPPFGYDVELPPISLLRLREFVISSYPAIIQSILSSIQFGSQTRLQLYVSLYEDLRSLFPRGPTRSPHTASVRPMDVDTIRLSRHGVYFIQNNSPAWNDEPSKFLLSVSSASPTSMPVCGSLNYVVNLSSIKHLEFNVGVLLDTSKKALQSLFNELEHLESLRTAFNDLENLLSVLGSIDESTGHLYLPRLTNLSFSKPCDIWWHFGERWIKPIMQTLKVRRDLSCALRTLELYSCSGVSSEMLEHLRPNTAERIIVSERGRSGVH